MNEAVEKLKDSKKKQSRLKFIIEAACLLFITAALVFIVFTQEQKPDPASEKAIRQAAAIQHKKDPNKLTDKDFASMSALTIFNQELRDIKLIEKFTNLQDLDIIQVKFPEKEIPRWMKILSKFGFIDINKRFAFDLDPIVKLENLKTIEFFAAPVKSFKPLSKLKNLEMLSISTMDIHDFESEFDRAALMEQFDKIRRSLTTL